MKLRLRHLRYTVAAAEHGSFRRAAERLRVQESAISRGVGEAEGIVGTRLFERSPKGVSLTAAGRMFVATSDDLLRQLSVLVSNLGRIEEPGDRKLRLGLACPLELGGFAQVLGACFADHPGICLELHEAAQDELISKLRDRELDAVLCAGGPPNGLHSHRIASERLMLVGRRDGLVGGDGAIAWADISAHYLTFDQSPLGASLQCLCERHVPGTTSRQILPVQRETLLRLIAANGGATILPEALTASLPPPLAACPIRNARLGIFLIWQAGRHGSLLRMLLGCAGALRPE